MKEEQLVTQLCWEKYYFNSCTSTDGNSICW